MDESILLQELDAPVRSFRLYAIEQIILNGKSQPTLEALQKRRVAEDDSECLMLLEHAIQTLQARIQGLVSSVTSEITVENFQKEFENKNPSQKIALLDNLPVRMRKELVPQAVSLTGTETDGMVRATLLRVFARVWPRDHLKDITLFLRADHLSTRVASLEILIQQAPVLLSRDLPKLLVNRDPRVRALAVRGLAQIDLEEALAHIEVLFDSGNSSYVVAALQNSIFFPFERIKPMLLKIIAAEKDPTMLVRIGLFLENNPDPEIPFRIWEIAESAEPGKKKYLHELVKNSCRNIEDSDILGDNSAEYRQKLQAWIQERAINRWMQDVVQRLSAPETNLDELEAIVKPRLKQEAVRLTCQKALDWPIPEVAKAALLKWLQPDATQILQSAQALATSFPAMHNKTASPIVTDDHQCRGSLDEFRKLTHNQQIRALSNWEIATHVSPPEGINPQPSMDGTLSGEAFLKILLDEIFKKADNPPDLLATAFRTALRFDFATFTNFARHHLKSKDPNLTQACLEFLGKYDFDWFATFLGTYLQSDNLRIKSCALRLLQKIDPQQSVSTLKTMLFSKNPEQQKASLACLIHFEFSLVRPMLCDFLRQTKDVEILNSGLLFFKANPENGNLYSLYVLEAGWRNDNWIEIADIAQGIRLENEKLLIGSGQLEAQEAKSREKEFVQRFAEEKSRATKAPSPYSVKKLSESDSSSIAALLDFLKNEFGGKSLREIGGIVWLNIADFGRQHPGVSVLGLLLLAGFWVFMGLESCETVIQKAQSTTIIASSITVEGLVIESSAEALVIAGKDGKTYAVYPPDGRQFTGNFLRKKVRVQLLAYQIDEGKIVRGNLQKISCI
ncbi:MAG: HEAT repeat domain-containing protein [Candidatus Ozemobacteraceae bacterium]